MVNLDRVQVLSFNNEDEVNSSRIQRNNNYQASSKKYWQTIQILFNGLMAQSVGEEAFIYRCLPPDTTWQKVKSPKAD